MPDNDRYLLSYTMSRMLIAMIAVAMIAACNRSAGGSTAVPVVESVEPVVATLDPYVVARETHDAARTVTVTSGFQLTVQAELTRLGVVEQTATATLWTATPYRRFTETPLPTADPGRFDSDGDRLSDSREATLGTDPGLADSDGDGLNDGEEVQVWWSDPLARDTDEDGLTDGREVNIAGTDPLNSDSDGDGIADGDDAAPTIFNSVIPTVMATPGNASIELCAGSPIPSRLAIGLPVTVTSRRVSSRIWDQPREANGAIIGHIPPGTTVLLLDGPVCDPDLDLRWWQVDYEGLVGWTTEGEGNQYYLAPAG